MTRLHVAVPGFALSVTVQPQDENSLTLHTEMLKFFDRHIGVSRPMAAASSP